MKFLRGLSSALLSTEKAFVVLFLSIMVVMAFLQVILRNFFHTGLLWADPLLRNLVLWVSFIGASIATFQEKHITLDFLSRFLKPARLHLVRGGTSLFGGAVTALLAHAGWTFVLNEREGAEALCSIGGTPLPAWWFELIIPIGFGLISLRFLLRAIEHAVSAISPGNETH